MSRAGRSMRAGSYGAIHGANKAHKTNTATSTTPAVASQLCPATRRKATSWAAEAIADILNEMAAFTMERRRKPKIDGELTASCLMSPL